MMKKILVSLLFLCGCHPSNPQEIQKEGDSQMRALITLFDQIETREDLIRLTPKIKARINKLVDLMVLSQLERGQDSTWRGSSAETSERLLDCMKRLYLIEGVREEMERIEQLSLDRLSSLHFQR